MRFKRDRIISRITPTLIILTCACYLGTCTSSMATLAQSSNAKIQSTASIPEEPIARPAPSGYVTGYVSDESGKSVPGANVSLWQNGQLWQPDKLLYTSSENPQASLYANSKINGLKEGGFLFGFITPGDHSLTAEKDEFKSDPVSAHVDKETINPNKIDLVTHPIMANLTLSSYHIPTLPKEQQLYTGTITGTLRTAFGYGASGINVSLWQNGRMVDRPDNPQSSSQRNLSGMSVDYIFDHLTPGHYTVMADYFAGGDYNDSVIVDVSSEPMRADILLSNIWSRPYGFPIVTFTPTVGKLLESPSLAPAAIGELSNASLIQKDPSAVNPTPSTNISESTQSPALSGIIVLGIFIMLVLYEKRLKR